MSLRIIFMGTPEFSVPTLSLLVDAGQKPHLTVGPWFHVSPELKAESARQTLVWMNEKLLGEPAPNRKAAAMAHATARATDAIPPAETEDVELYHARSWWTKYVFCQDAKVIAIQYSVTALAIGLVALVLSWLMRLQLGFPDTFSIIDATQYYQFITMHGMIMVIYLLTALFLGGFGNYLIPLMSGARDMAYPRLNAFTYWSFLLSGLFLYVSPFMGQSPHAGWFSSVPYTLRRYFVLSQR